MIFKVGDTIRFKNSYIKKEQDQTLKSVMKSRSFVIISGCVCADDIHYKAGIKVPLNDGWYQYFYLDTDYINWKLVHE